MNISIDEDFHQSSSEILHQTESRFMNETVIHELRILINEMHHKRIFLHLMNVIS